MRPIAIAAILGFAVMPLVPADARAASVESKTVTYPISGSNGSELLDAMDRHGPKHGFLTRAIAQTSYTITWAIDWKEKAATTPDGAVLGLGSDIGPMGICYRTDLLQQAGLPTDPAQLSAQMPDWNGFLALGEKFQAAAPAGTAWHDSAGGLYNAIVSTQQQSY